MSPEYIHWTILTLLYIAVWSIPLFKVKLYYSSDICDMTITVFQHLELLTVSIMLRVIHRLFSMSTIMMLLCKLYHSSDICDMTITVFQHLEL